MLRSVLKLVFCAVVVSANFGCGDDEGSTDAAIDVGSGGDSGTSDAGSTDLGGLPDLGDPADSGRRDAGPDAGGSDAGATDAAAGDLGVDAAIDAGAPCGDGVVDPVTELCDPGIDRCCAADCSAVLDANEVCRASMGTCDPEELCDGVSAQCPDDVVADDFSACVGCVGTSSTTCLGCYMGSCAPYTSPCLEILDGGQSTGDGIYDIPMAQTATTTLPVFCDMTIDGGGWTMLFKKSAGVAGSSHLLWTGGGTNAMSMDLLDRERETSDYVSPFIDQIWPAFTELRVEVITGTITAKVLHFDAAGSDTIDWFSPERVTMSSWTDLPTDPSWENGNGRFFSIQGINSRTFYINAVWNGCPNDAGWLMVTTSNFCFWEGRSADAPTEIMYSSLDTIASVPNTNQMLFADALIVFAR